MTNCPNCGAPVDLSADACAFCDTPYTPRAPTKAPPVERAQVGAFTVHMNAETLVKAYETGVLTPSEVRECINYDAWSRQHHILREYAPKYEKRVEYYEENGSTHARIYTDYIPPCVTVKPVEQFEQAVPTDTGLKHGPDRLDFIFHGWDRFRFKLEQAFGLAGCFACVGLIIFIFICEITKGG